MNRDLPSQLNLKLPSTNPTSPNPLVIKSTAVKKERAFYTPELQNYDMNLIQGQGIPSRLQRNHRFSNPPLII